MDGAYRSDAQDGEGSDVLDSLEAYVREGARRMLAAALEEEVTTFLGRGRYERGKPYRGYRNGHHPARELTVGVGAVAVRVPRVADVPSEVAPHGFQSQVVARYQRSSPGTQELCVRLYLEGLATGDFEPVFRELVGETTALSANAVVRLKERWAEEYDAWKQRSLGEHHYAYTWSDGVYLGVGAEAEKTALLCVLGAREDGTKDLLALELGYRESTESWAGVLRGLRERGLTAPLVAIGDGGWACGPRWTRSFRAPRTSAAGTIACSTSKPSCPNDWRPRHPPATGDCRGGQPGRVRAAAGHLRRRPPCGGPGIGCRDGAAGLGRLRHLL